MRPGLGIEAWAGFVLAAVLTTVAMGGMIAGLRACWPVRAHCLDGGAP